MTETNDKTLNDVLMLSISENRIENVSSLKKKRIPIDPRFSIMKWDEVSRKATDLSGLNKEEKKKQRYYTMEQVSQHDSIYDGWTVYDKKVYNLSPFLKYHPGGLETTMLGVGGDCTNQFNEFHAYVNGHSMLKKCYIGELKEEFEDEKKKEVNFLKWRWQSFELIQKKKFNYCNYILLRFNLPKEYHEKKHCIIGKYVFIRRKIGHQWIERPYTPLISSFNDEKENSFDFLIKVYQNGLMSKALNELNIGEYVDILGLKGHFWIEKIDRFRFHSITYSSISSIVCIAGGSGITPMLNIISYYLSSSSSTSEVYLKLFTSFQHINEFKALKSFLSFTFKNKESSFNGSFETIHCFSQSQQKEEDDDVDNMNNEEEENKFIYFNTRINQQILMDHGVNNLQKNQLIFLSGPFHFNQSIFNCCTKELKISSANIIQF